MVDSIASGLCVRDSVGLCEKVFLCVYVLVCECVRVCMCVFFAHLYIGLCTWI